MSHPSHHFALHKAFNHKKTMRSVDAMAYAVGVLGNAAVIPQIIKAWQSKAPGLAIMTWLLFVVIGVIWLMYAVLHKQKPLILAQTVGLTVNLAVVMGWLMNNLH